MRKTQKGEKKHLLFQRKMFPLLPLVNLAKPNLPTPWGNSLAFWLDLLWTYWPACCTILDNMLPKCSTVLANILGCSKIPILGQFFGWIRPSPHTHTFFKIVFEKRNRFSLVDDEAINQSNTKLLVLLRGPFHFDKKHKQNFKKPFPDIPVLFIDREMCSWYGSQMKKGLNYLRQQKVHWKL